MPLTPLSFLERSADVWADRPAVRDGEREWTYSEHADRVRRLISVIGSETGVVDGDRIATLLPNVAAALELHYAIPGAGGVLVPLNTRLAAADYAYIIEHSGAKVVITSRSLRQTLDDALTQIEGRPPRVIVVDSDGSEASEYECLIADASPGEIHRPSDEHSLLSINYTSGTTGRPKGVMTSHRGAYLHSLGVIADAHLTSASTYLWTLPMFHCNGWAYTWAVTAMGARHVCLASTEAEVVWQLLRHGVTHMCAAPTVVTMLLDSPSASPCSQRVQLFVGGAPPSATLLEKASRLNVEVTHLYGLTETYGPIAVCAWQPDWDELPIAEQSRLRARQGVGTVVSERLRVVDRDMRDVPRDGQTLGEVVMRGNNVMLGYYRDADATKQAFAGGWFHSGDLAIIHPDGYIELRDRVKDIVISGGENIATIEVEQALTAHASVSEAAVVGRPDEKWGEVPVAFVTTNRVAEIDVSELRQYLRARLAHFKVPKSIEVVDELPKTGTGKIQKFVLRDRARAQTRLWASE